MPSYDLSQVSKNYDKPLIEDDITLPALVKRKALGHDEYACILGSHKTSHANIRIIKNFPNLTALRGQVNFLSGTTYWINDYLHVGHVHYDKLYS
jgi:hypothetical protein